MDASRIDALTRSVAVAGSRRGLLRAFGFGGGAALATSLVTRTPATVRAQDSDESVTCKWLIEAQVSTGPNKGDGYNGILEITISPNGVIEEGEYVLVDSNWDPITDDNGDDYTYRVTGSAHQHTLGFRAERSDCEELSFQGVSRYKIRSCRGPISGSFQGPELTDLGGWRTYRKVGCGPCRGLICPWGEYVDPDECDCVEECPRGYEECQGCVCAPTDCPDGGSYDPETCTCDSDCKRKDCDPGYSWSSSRCECVKDQCEERDCDDPYVWSDSQCACVCEERQCDSGYAWDWDRCGCYPKDCEERQCDPGYAWDSDRCDCYPTDCQERQCDGDYKWDWDACDCVCGLEYCDGDYFVDQYSCQCLPCNEYYECDSGYSWDTHTCQCRQNCPEETCEQGKVWDPNYCECVSACPGVDCTYGGATLAFYLDPYTCECLCYDPTSTKCGLTCGYGGCACDEASSTCQCPQGTEGCNNMCMPVCTGGKQRDFNSCQCV